MRWVQLAVAITTVSAFFVAVASTRGGAKAQTAQTAAADTCEPTIEGWRFPASVPSYMQWEPVLAALASSDTSLMRRLNVTASTADRIKANAAAGITRAKDLKAALGESAMASAIVDARDDLIRLLPKATFDELQAAVIERTSATAFSVPAHGKRMPVDTMSMCQLSADAHKDRYLVPEFVLWDAYFSAVAAAAAPSRQPDGSFPGTFIGGMRTGIKISPSSMNYFLAVACDTAARVTSLRADDAPESDLATTVMSARADLIRSLPAKDWTELNLRAARSGGRYAFPASW